MNFEEKKTKKNILEKKKVLVCSKGPPLSPWFFFRKMFGNFFFSFHKKCIFYQFKIVSKKWASNKKNKEIFRQEGLQIAAFQQSVSQCW